MSPKPAPLTPSSANSARSILAENIVRLRAQKEWSQETLGFEAGLHRTFIAHVERCARNISIDNLEKIAFAFGIETYKLLQPHTGQPN
ncbi:helix-turn-helix transcriptional regulator [Oxalobacteraceae sp. CFBP 8755]|nr:helix-turn-helix transcriptional regulator [Oxalobacteraceae sp. CFBP 8755]MBD8721754.1 helix-turn-helix transcriptional regulator [Oxalobacteraceae sp. CFBP 13708]